MTADAITEAATISAHPIVHESEAERATLTQGATQVQVPDGQNIVRIQVTPGETIQLPFAQDQMVARLDDGNGNLAIRVGDVTVVLQGYIAAAGEGDVNLIDSNGAVIDVAAVVAATDPNLDIETAAGPAAGAPGAGADNTGGVFSPFDPTAGIGGLNGIGGLDPTVLNYRLIQREAIVFEEDEEEEVVTSGPVITEVVGGLVNEDDLGSGFNDYYDEFREDNPFQPLALIEGLINNFCQPFAPGNDSFDDEDKDGEIVDNSPFGDAITGYEAGSSDTSPTDFDREPLVYKGSVTVDFGAAGPGLLQFPADIVTQMELLGLTSNGLPLQYQVIGDLLQGYVFDGECHYLVLQAKIDAATDNGDGTTTFDFYFLLDKNLDHPAPLSGLTDETDLPVPIPFEAVDAGGTAVGGSIIFEVRDDIPFIEEGERGFQEVHEDALSGGNEEGGQTTNATFFLSSQVSFGADQPGTYGVNTALLAVPVDSGLTSLGEIVNFVMIDATHIEGHADGGRVIFTIEVDPLSGIVTFELKDQLDHGMGQDDDDNATVDLALTDLFVATDSDGDSVILGGNLEVRIENDIPVISDNVPDASLVHEDALEGGNEEGGQTVLATIDLGALVNVGADEPVKSFGVNAAYLDLPVDTGLTSLGETINFVMIDATYIEGHADNGRVVFTLAIDADTGVVTFELKDQVDHGLGVNDLDSVTVNLDLNHLFQVTDADDDVAIFEEGLSVLIENDVPVLGGVVDFNTGESGPFLIDEDNIANGIQGGPGDDAGGGAVLYKVEVNFGADQPGGFAFTGATASAPLMTADGQAITIGILAVGVQGLPAGSLVGYTGGNINNPDSWAFTATLDPDFGGGQFSLLQALYHPATDDVATKQIETAFEDNIVLTLNVRAMDADDDYVDADIVINIDDDSPTLAPTGPKPQLVVDETSFATDDSKSFAGVFVPDYGADGAGTVEGFKLGVSEPGAVSGVLDVATGNQVFLFLEGDVVVGREGTDELDAETGEIVFTVSVDAVGNVTLDQQRAVRHDDPEDADEEASPVTLSAADLVTLTATVTDKDGDQVDATANIGTSLNFEDDGPDAVDDGPISVLALNAEVTGNVLDNDDVGADATNAAPKGTVVSFVVNGTLYNAGDTAVITGLGSLTIHPDGSYSFTQTSAAESALNISYEMTDGDGDSDTATLTLSLVRDGAAGTLSAEGCVAEDNQPNQWSGDQTVVAEALAIAFDNADNETVTGAAIDIPAGWQLQVWDPGSNTQVALLAAGAGVDISAHIVAVLAGTLELRPVPPVNTDVDGNFTLHLDILDPDTNATATLDEAFTVFVDAVADKPTNVSIVITDGGYQGTGQDKDKTLGIDDGTFVKNETGELHVTATFGDIDGSETHTVRVDLPSGFVFENVPLTIPGVASYLYDGNDLILTMAQGTTSFSYDFDIKASGIGNNTVFDAYGTTDPFRVTAEAAETTLSGGGCGPDGTDADPSNPDGALDNQSTTIATLNRPNILNGEFVTNTNVQKQVALVTFVDKQDPLRAYSQLVVRGSQGQQGAILADAGFLIDQTHDYLVGAEATAGTKVIITDMSLEGVRIVDPGNAQVEVNNTATMANEGTAIVTTINPTNDAGAYVGFEYSKDDNLAGGNGALTDADAATDDYVFGAAGADTITAVNNGTNILNGGDILSAANNGADNITGGSGTDILVFDPLDTFNGGDGFDILRVDEGAIFNTMTKEGLSTIGLGIDGTVDLSGKPISNIESILITEEAIPDAAAGTTIILNAGDVISYTDGDNELYVIGSDGDKLDLNNANGFTAVADGTLVDEERGMTFNVYDIKDAGNQVVGQIYVDQDVQVI